MENVVHSFAELLSPDWDISGFTGAKNLLRAKKINATLRTTRKHCKKKKKEKRMNVVSSREMGTLRSGPMTSVLLWCVARSYRNMRLALFQQSQTSFSSIWLKNKGVGKRK